MIVDVLFAAFLAELSRGAYYTWKEQKRKELTLDSFGEILQRSSTMEELSRNLYADKANNPVLYKKIKQTWMIRLYNKLAKE